MVDVVVGFVVVSAVVKTLVRVCREGVAGQVVRLPTSKRRCAGRMSSSSQNLQSVCTYADVMKSSHNSGLVGENVAA